MSNRKSKGVAGVQVRHGKHCKSTAGGRCNCTPTYQAHVWDSARRRRAFRRFATLSEAKLWRAEATVAVRSGTMRSATDTPLIGDELDDMIGRMRDGRLLNRSGERYKPMTVRTYAVAVEKYVTPRFGHRRLHDLTRRDVQTMVDDLLAGGASASTCRKALDPLRVLYKWAARRDLVTTSPCDNLLLPVNRPKAIDVVAPEDVPAYLDALPDSDRAMWAIAFYAGLRRGEIRALRWRNIDLSTGTINVNKSWDDVEGEQDPKSRAGTRMVPAIPQLVSELARHGLATGGDGDDLVCGTTATEPFGTSSAHRRSTEAFRDAGLRHVTLHNARHAATSYLLRAGLSLHAVMVYLGHSDIRMTMHYAHTLPGAQSHDADRIGAWLSDVTAQA